MSRGPLVLGGLGHALCRLAPARATARSTGFDVKEVLYPGFEGRPCAASWDDFLDQVAQQVEIYRLSHARRLVYATGFGSLVALALRGRGELAGENVVIQGAVPWETVCRFGGRGEVGRTLQAKMREPDFRRRFAERHFQRTLEADQLRAFFDGHASCDAYEGLFTWLDAGWLAGLEGALAARPAALERIAVWLGGRDRLVAPGEQIAARRALGVEWPESRVEEWGHFPYLDDPGPWIGAISHGLG